jgi:hypothetical protein
MLVSSLLIQEHRRVVATPASPTSRGVDRVEDVQALIIARGRDRDPPNADAPASP